MPTLSVTEEKQYSHTTEEKPRKSYGKSDIIEDTPITVRIGRPRSGSTGKGEHTNIPKDSLPVSFKRKESIGKLAIRSFNYNDPDLAFQMSPTGPVVMGGTKAKLISLLTDITVIGL